MSKIKDLFTEDQIATLHDAAIDNLSDFLENDLGVMFAMCPCMTPIMSGSGLGDMSLNLNPQEDCLACQGSGIAIADKAAVEAAEAAGEVSEDEFDEEGDLP